MESNKHTISNQVYLCEDKIWETKLRKKILNQILKCLSDFGIELCGPIILGLSGGKDSTLLSILLTELGFDVKPVVVDLGYSNFNIDSVRSALNRRGISIEVVSVSDVCTRRELNKYVRHQVLLNLKTLNNPTEKTPCGACSQIKRYLLAHCAIKLGSKWVALAHHRNDLLTTLLKDYFIDLYYSKHGRYDQSQFRTFTTEQDIDTDILDSMVKQQIAGTMSIQTHITTGVSLVRPMAYVLENDIITLIQDIGAPICQSGCSHDVFTHADRTLSTKREIVHAELHRRLKQSDNLADQLLKVALRSLDSTGKTLANPRATRSFRYPGFADG